MAGLSGYVVTDHYIAVVKEALFYFKFDRPSVLFKKEPVSVKSWRVTPDARDSASKVDLEELFIGRGEGGYVLVAESQGSANSTRWRVVEHQEQLQLVSNLSAEQSAELERHYNNNAKCVAIILCGLNIADLAPYNDVDCAAELFGAIRQKFQPLQK